MSDWRPIESVPVNERVLVWVTGRLLPGARFGWAYKSGDKIMVKPDGCNGDWNKDITHWQPLPEPPQ